MRRNLNPYSLDELFGYAAPSHSVSNDVVWDAAEDFLQIEGGNMQQLLLLPMLHNSESSRMVATDSEVG